MIGATSALSGIAEAAVMQGDERVAKTNFKALLKIWSTADPGISRLAEAQAYLREHSTDDVPMLPYAPKLGCRRAMKACRP